MTEDFSAPQQVMTTEIKTGLNGSIVDYNKDIHGFVGINYQVCIFRSYIGEVDHYKIEIFAGDIIETTGGSFCLVRWCQSNHKYILDDIRAGKTYDIKRFKNRMRVVGNYLIPSCKQYLKKAI